MLNHLRSKEAVDLGERLEEIGKNRKSKESVTAEQRKLPLETRVEKSKTLEGRPPPSLKPEIGSEEIQIYLQEKRGRRGCGFGFFFLGEKSCG